MTPTAAPTIDRRRCLALAGAALLASAHAGATAERQAAAAAFRIPGDFEPLAAVWLGYDAGHEDIGATLLRELQPHVTLKLLVRSEADLEAARAAWRARGIDGAGIEVHVDSQAMYFMRDAAVFAVSTAGELAIVDFRWTQYGLPAWCRRRYAGDDGRTAQCEEGVDALRDETDRRLAELAGARVIASALAMEGGGVESNGAGLLIANEALWRERNPHRRGSGGAGVLDAAPGAGRAAGAAAALRDGIERELLRLPGVRKVLWLPAGLAQDPLHRATIVGNHVAWGTGGHTDEFVRFADARTVLLAWPDERLSHPVTRLNAQRMRRNFEILSRASGADGEPLQVLKVPLPYVVERRVFLSAAADTALSQEWSAELFPAHERRREGDAVMQVASTSYLNFVVANGVVLLPDYVPHGTPRALQQRVVRVFEKAFPGRRIRFVDAIGLNWVGGGPHCATLSEPARG